MTETATDHYRKVVIDQLVPHFQRDERYYLLAGDMGFGAIDRLRARFPRRVVNFGVMEPGACGIAAGMSLSGLIPIVYSIVNFLAFRALEQIRNDVVLQRLNVKFLGTGANDYFRFLGSSHCCGQEDVALMKLVGMRVYDPYAPGADFDALREGWITSPEAGYLRV
jgi:transketolase